MTKDNWAYKSTFCCETCFYFVPKEKLISIGKDVGRCRYNPPEVIKGWPVVFPADFCGQHKLANSPK